MQLKPVSHGTRAIERTRLNQGDVRPDVRLVAVTLSLLCLKGRPYHDIRSGLMVLVY
jgi:hypothetical protein